MLPTPRETELKLFLTPAARDRLLDCEELSSAPHSELLHTHYYDTPDFSLARMGLALRVRRAGRRWVQTLKAEGVSKDGLSVRPEWEVSAPGGVLDTTRFPAEALARLPHHGLEHLSVQYETRFTRRTWRMQQGVSQIEVALDDGEILAGEARQPLLELELELKTGQAESLHQLAERLATHALLLPFDTSKAARGAALALGVKPAPVAARAVAVDGDLPPRRAFVALARGCLSHFQANLPGVLTAHDPEYLHQARVALRRFHSLVRLFANAGVVLPDAPWSRHLQDVGQAMGPVRDWDVFLAETLHQLARRHPQAAAWAELEAEAVTRRQEAGVQLDRQLDQPATGRMLIDWAAWLRALETQPEQDWMTLAVYARLALAEHWKDVTRLLRRWTALDESARHKLRIRIKRLRYALEFFAPLLDKSARSMLKSLVRWQGALGHLNDLATARGLLLRLRGGPASLHATGWLDGYYTARSEAEIAGLEGLLPDILQLKCPRPA